MFQHKDNCSATGALDALGECVSDDITSSGLHCEHELAILCQLLHESEVNIGVKAYTIETTVP